MNSNKRVLPFLIFFLIFLNSAAQSAFESAYRPTVISGPPVLNSVLRSRIPIRIPLNFSRLVSVEICKERTYSVHQLVCSYVRVSEHIFDYRCLSPRQISFGRTIHHTSLLQVVLHIKYVLLQLLIFPLLLFVSLVI